MTPPLLQLIDVRTHFPVESGILRKRRTGTLKAVDGISFSLQPGEVLGLVGESGCGKSTLARTIMQLLPTTGGTVMLGGKNLTTSTGALLRAARKDMQMVFQDPYASLNPQLTVQATIAEPLRVHALVPEDAIANRVGELLHQVGLEPRHLSRYPHEFSGGQRQRIAIARALALEPRLLIADEPVSALDVSVQAQIINLLAELVRTLHLAMLFIAHDLSVVRHVSDRIAVMYLGKIIELGPAEEIISSPRHPYTRALISAIPVPDPTIQVPRLVLAGEPPSPLHPPTGCAFHPRCPYAQDRCRTGEISLLPAGSHRTAACVRLDEI